MNQCQPVLKQQDIIKTIVHWENHRGCKSHCLARVLSDGLRIRLVDASRELTSAEMRLLRVGFVGL